MTINEWAKDFRSFVNELQMPRDDYKSIMSYIDDVLALLKEQDNCENCAIAIEDRQPVVRCRDCKYWRTNTEFCMHWSVANAAHHTTPDWFCADGKRR